MTPKAPDNLVPFHLPAQSQPSPLPALLAIRNGLHSLAGAWWSQRSRCTACVCAVLLCLSLVDTPPINRVSAESFLCSISYRFPLSHTQMFYPPPTTVPIHSTSHDSETYFCIIIRLIPVFPVDGCLSISIFLL